MSLFSLSIHFNSSEFFESFKSSRNKNFIISSLGLVKGKARNGAANGMEIHFATLKGVQREQARNYELYVLSNYNLKLIKREARIVVLLIRNLFFITLMVKKKNDNEGKFLLQININESSELSFRVSAESFFPFS